MCKDLITFNNEEFEVKAVMLKGEPWFLGKQLAEKLEYKNTRDALSKHVDSDEKITVAIHDGNKGNPNQTFVNESGLLSLVLSSKMPKAKKFRKWITKEVLPSIHKNGGYVQENREEEFINKMFPSLSDEVKLMMVKELQQSVKELQPKAQNYDLLMNSKGNQSIGQFSKTLNIGRNTMFGHLRTMKLLDKNNIPYQRYLEQGTFISKEITVNGHNTTQTFITSKGMDYVVRKLKENKVIE